MSVQIERRFFSVDEYRRMAIAGILSEDDHVELIEGEIVKMSPIGSRHVGCVNRLTSVLSLKVGGIAIVSVQNPIYLNDFSEPEPDIALLKPRNDFYSQSLATASDAFLIIEVADTSFEYDRNVKLPLYAQGGVLEVWLINLMKSSIDVYLKPVNGLYQIQREAKRGENISPENLAELMISVDEILG